MSNPIVSFSNSPAPTLPLHPNDVPSTFATTRDRESWLQIVFSNQKFYQYGIGEFSEPLYPNFDPLSYGERFYVFVPLGKAFGAGSPAIAKPDFVSDKTWDQEQSAEADKAGLFWQPSGFVNAVNSVMPKLMMSSVMLVQNGSTDIVNFGEGMIKVEDANANRRSPFKWSVIEWNGAAFARSMIRNIGFSGTQPYYFAWRGKAKNIAQNEVKLRLPQIAAADRPEGDWTPAALVVQGAFCLSVRLTPHQPILADPDDVSQQTWSVEIQLEELKMLLQEGGALTALVSGGDQDGNVGSVNMPEAASSERPPQNEHYSGKKPYTIIVYPVWNGVVITSGIQDVRPSVDAASLFVPKRKSASILDESIYNLTPFNPDSPNEVIVNVGVVADDTDVMVDFGDKIDVTAKGCDIEISYAPLFYSPRMWMDEWFLGNKDGDSTWTHEAWPIWTQNGNTAYDLVYGISDPSKDGEAGTDTKYFIAKWKFEEANQKPSRVGPQLFGTILRTKERPNTSVRNGNGAFDISVGPPDGVYGLAGDPQQPALGSTPTNWKDYIQSVNVTITPDSTSGSMVVDKFGFAGQEAVANQSVGMVRLAATGGYDTVPGEFFIGMGMGISDSRSTSGATWTIPLVGFEQKMNDIQLVNAPFVDGWRAATAIEYLMYKWAGMGIINNSGTAWLERLKVSEDLEAPVFNWQAGTSIKEALDQIVKDVQLAYTVELGKLRIFELGSDGYPILPSPYDWEQDYPDVVIMSYDQSPVLDNLRNEIIVVGLEQVISGTGTDIADLPLFPKLHLESQNTKPSIPWAKRLVYVTQGVVDTDVLEDIAQKLSITTRTYDVTGRTTIPGNADIRLYDKWGSYFIISITHNVDVQGKVWTTELEFAGGDPGGYP